jgi:holo-[acyl-carrier protein] synthase
LRVGIDMVRIADVRAALDRHGEVYLTRVFTPGEVVYCRSRGAGLWDSLAARFAAKEAVAKALEVGDGVFDLREVEVVRSHSGACGLQLHGRAQRTARRSGLSGWSVSLTHEGEYAAAVVIVAERSTIRPARRARRSRGA